MTVSPRSLLATALGVLTLPVALLAFRAQPAAAQLVESERIVAVIGDDVILLSELEEQTAIAAAQEGVDPTDTQRLARLRSDILEQMVSDLVVVAAASADDSVEVTETSVNEAVEAELAQIRARFPSAPEFEREIERSQWRTLENYRKNLRRIKRRELLAQQYLGRHASEILSAPVTDEEVRAYFEENRARFGSKPATVKIRELDLLVRPTEAAREAARALADSLARELRAGADFTAIARAFSDDPGTAERGGDLGYFKKGAMLPAFEDAAFAIDSIGGLAGPVEGPFGFHIIRLDDRQGEEIKARHVLITPEISEADRSATRAVGLAVVDSLAAGADFEALLARHSNSPRPSTEPIEGPLNQLPSEWQEALRDLPIGGTTGLLETPAGYAILRLEGRGGGEPYTFEELEARLRSQLAQNRGQRAFIEGLRKQVYVDVRLPEAAAAAPTAEAPAAAARDAYTPTAERGPSPQLDPLDNPAPIADTPPPDSVPNPPLPAHGVEAGAPGRVDPTGAVDSIPEESPPER